MKKTFGYILLALIAVSCSDSDDIFRLKGKFKNFNQGEITIFSQMGRGSIDTVRLAEGKFTYDLTQEQLDSFHREMNLLVRKKKLKAMPDGMVEHIARMQL